MIVCLIAAVGNQGQIGHKGLMPWHDTDDLQFFKQITMGHVLIVGWKTSRLLPDLPGRDVVIDNVEMTPEHVLALDAWANRIVFIGGGVKTYQRFLPFVRRSFITRVNYDGPADVYMPPLWGDENAGHHS